MNSKLIGYEEAKAKLKQLESIQKQYKKALKSRRVKGYLQSTIYLKKQEINMYLSIIHAHKEARKYYGKLKYE